MELSEAAKNYVFPIGEYHGQRPSEMLNHYLVIQKMDYLLSRDWIPEETKSIYKELINYARNKYDWVSYIVRNETLTQRNEH